MAGNITSRGDIADKSITGNKQVGSDCLMDLMKDLIM